MTTLGAMSKADLERFVREFGQMKRRLASLEQRPTAKNPSYRAGGGAQVFPAEITNNGAVIPGRANQWFYNWREVIPVGGDPLNFASFDYVPKPGGRVGGGVNDDFPKASNRAEHNNFLRSLKSYGHTVGDLGDVTVTLLPIAVGTVVDLILEPSLTSGVLVPKFSAGNEIDVVCNTP